MLDGVFATDSAGAVRFHPAARLTPDDVAAVLTTIERRIGRLLKRRGLADTHESGGAAGRWSTTPERAAS